MPRKQRRCRAPVTRDPATEAKRDFAVEIVETLRRNDLGALIAATIDALDYRFTQDTLAAERATRRCDPPPTPTP